MRLIIETIEGQRTDRQLEAVKSYVLMNSYAGEILETKKDEGKRIGHKYGVNHVSCHKTKKGYSFKVWRAI